MKEADVHALLGEPTWVDGVTPGRETWNYHPVPIYLLGATLQVHFQDGAVRYWEPYDW